MEIIKPRIEIEQFNGVDIMKKIERACRTCYRSEGSITEDSYKNLLRNCINRGHESVLEHEKITVRMLCSINTYKDLTRHRAGASFSIESTRYCNYSKDKFGKEITVIRPLFFEEGSDKDVAWTDAMASAERMYFELLDLGATPQEARSVLPNSTKTEITITANYREWRNFFKLRTAKAAHPQMQEVTRPLLKELKTRLPIIFDDIEVEE